MGLALWLGAAGAGLLSWWLFALLLAFIALSLWKINLHTWLLLVAILAGALSLGVREYSLRHSIATSLISRHTSISLEAIVRSDPAITTPKVVGNNRRAAQTTFLIMSEEITSGSQGMSADLPFRVVTATQVHFIPGDGIHLAGKIVASTEKNVAGLIVVKGSIELRQHAPIAQQLAAHIRMKFALACARIRGNAGALIPGLVLGDTSLESPSLIANMKRTGLTHLTAVSGENFAIISSFLMSYLSGLIRPLRGRLVVVAIVLAGFILIVRPSPSVLRAAVMSGVLLIAHARGERRSALPSLGLAIALLIIVNPFLAIDPGFALSVSATAGILILHGPLDRLIAPMITSSKVRELVVIPLAATIFCLPIIVALSGQISPQSIPANILASLALAPITIIGFLAALLASISSLLTHLLLLPLGLISSWISWVADFFSRFPVLTVPHSYWGAGLILTVVLLRKYWRRLMALLILFLLATSFLNSSWPGSDWLMAICDVGQGDGFAIHLAKDRAIVVDSGPDPKLIDSCLSRLGVREIPLLILTHFHADHVGGLSGIIHGRHIDSYWISSDHQPAREYATSMAALSPLIAREVFAGENFTLSSQYGPVQIDVLSPNPSLISRNAHQGGSDINNSSIAALITIDGLRIFAAGDIEPETQGEILRDFGIKPVDILKVAHHGSSHQDPELERALRPRIALISVGVGNPYGHPSLATIGRLGQLGARTYRTDLDGAISLAPSLRIRALKRDRWKISWG